MAPLPFLDWPLDLFAAAHAAAAALSPPRTPLFNEKNCACGCNQKHNRAVSALEGEGDNRRVLWFRTIACKNKHKLHWYED
jgi:CXCXC repeat